ncbi:C-type lectin domain family 4 member A-like isoform X1 [Onychostruthus taczanowskii]|uniref:C-type lectin domain family 4 member A-like isoform X1 n=1 Tax=Onychostruthus taczanowskii TaxID=356909 RepID=UPI001B8086B1|nr:C-type lectin domain family 4 member A-like isoform X1 [Onychostruthus taczanowskii]
MASEITYAEVKFKNESPAPVVKGPPETKKPEQHPQKYPLWLPWLISLLLLLVCIALVVVLLVLPLCHSSGQPSALQQQFSEWECDSAVPQGTDRGWTCCPKGWRRFQGSCYFLSTDKLSCDKSAQNCTGMGSQLVVINSKAEQEFLSEQTKQTPKRMNVYIGLFENKVGQWQWVDKTPYNVTAAFWREGEPSPDYDENCTVIYVPEPTFHNWNDVKATMLHHRICEAAAVFV